MQKELTDAERELWRRFAHDVRPLRGTSETVEVRPAETPTPSSPAVAVAMAAPRHGGKAGTAVLVIGTRGDGLDDTGWRALGTGRLMPSRRLDLHGHTTDAAFRELGRFLRQASADRLRLVEIITGHGHQTGGGAIRRELPHWLNRPDLRTLIIAARHPERGNEGAVRILLRRRRGA